MAMSCALPPGCLRISANILWVLRTEEWGLMLAEWARALGFEVRQTWRCPARFHPDACASRLTFFGCLLIAANKEPNNQSRRCCKRVTCFEMLADVVAYFDWLVPLLDAA
jgi:hypothetical protein